MAHLHTCVKVGNQIQYTGPTNGNHFLKSGEIGTITDILLWIDENPGMYMICVQFEHTSFTIKLSEICPNDTKFRLYHSDETLKMMKDCLHHFGIEEYKVKNEIYL